MELATTLKSQTVRNSVREVGINANYWYPVGWAHELKPGEVTPVVIWQQAIAVYRSTNGQLHALEDACPHRGVALHKGKVQGDYLACRYHGWQFDGEGRCAAIPYLPTGQKFPCAKARSYPIQEKYGLIWVFPGNPDLASVCHPPHVEEYGQPGWLNIPLAAHFQAHFSICNENAMDVFHGFLHEDLQGWFDPVLTDLRETESSVCAEYRVSYKGRLAKFLGLSEHADEVTTLPVSIRYHYPHYHSTLQGVSSLYLMRLPVSPTESRSFALFFFKVRLPEWLLNPMKPLLRPILHRFVLLKFLAQDIEMMESEQERYLEQPDRRYVEINPAIIALQRLTVRQYERFIRGASEFNGYGNAGYRESVSSHNKASVSGQSELTQEFQ
jgi:renierapurpurin 18,18'-hydroxylase